MLNVYHHYCNQYRYGDITPETPLEILLSVLTIVVGINFEKELEK